MFKKHKQILINNINYELNDSTATVVESENATGDIIIPKYVEFGNEKFPVNEIGQRGFYGSKITSISFPEDSEVKVFGNQIFSTCDSIKTIKLPPKLALIGKGWCAQTPSLEKVEITNGSQNYITENEAIYKSDKSELLFCNRNVESFEIPAPVSEIRIFAFHIQKLKKVTFSENSNLKVIDCSSFRGSAIEEIELPPTLQVIKDYAFYQCKLLKKVVFNKGSQLKEILHHAFDGTAITEITLSGPLNLIGMCCFKNARNLSKLTISNEVSAEIMKDAFCNVSEKFTIFARKNSSIKFFNGQVTKIVHLVEPNDEVIRQIQHLQNVIDWMCKQPQCSS